jgi:tryptophan synthase alpha chain
MSYLETYIKERSSQKFFLPYLSLGDPNYESSIDFATSLMESGDILELGIPFTDPIADGPVIQKSYKRALDNSPFTMDKIFDTTLKISEKIQKKPIVFLSYLNPIIHYGLEKFFQNCSNSGVYGLVLPDIPFDSKDYPEIFKIAKKNNVDMIQLVTPATSEKRMKKMKEVSGGFIYYVTSFGVTGERKDIDPNIDKRIQLIQKIFKIPVMAGFGISTPEQASNISKYSDGIIIGSAIQKIVESESNNQFSCSIKLKDYSKLIKQALVS